MRHVVCSTIFVAVPLFLGVSTAVAQPAPLDDAAFVTNVDGPNVTIVRLDGESVIVNASTLSSSDRTTNELIEGGRIRTNAAGSAVLFFPNSGAVIHLGESTDVRLGEASSQDHSLNIIVSAGRATMVRRADAGNWLVLGAEITGGPAGYVLSKDASVVVEVMAGKITFSARRGQLLLFEGAVPRGKIFDANDRPLNTKGIVVSEGKQRTLGVLGDAVPDPRAGKVVPDSAVGSAWRFAHGQSFKWLEDAEAGDFTPVKAPGGDTLELLGSEVEPSLVFDQARPVLTASTGSTGATPVQPRPSTAQTLVESNIPGTVVAARRFAGSRIIGISGQSGTGALFVNVTALTLPIRLGRQ